MSEPCNCEQAQALEVENARLSDALNERSYDDALVRAVVSEAMVTLRGYFGRFGAPNDVERALATLEAYVKARTAAEDV